MHLAASAEYLHIVVVGFRAILIANTQITGVAVPATHHYTDVWLWALVGVRDIHSALGTLNAPAHINPFSFMIHSSPNRSLVPSLFR